MVQNHLIKYEITPFFSVSIIDFKQVDVSWVVFHFYKHIALLRVFFYKRNLHAPL